MNQNIVLIGFMGSGKSSVGVRLAEELSFDFVDTDEMIEEENHTTISSIFAENGEEYFRNLETSTIENMALKTNHAVVSTGGGLPLREKNAEILKRLGFVVYLKVKKETVLKRLEGDTKRPLLQGDNVEEKVENMLSFRDPIYEFGAHMVIEVDDKSFEEIIEEIKRNFSIICEREKQKSGK